MPQSALRDFTNCTEFPEAKSPGVPKISPARRRDVRHPWLEILLSAYNRVTRFCGRAPSPYCTSLNKCRPWPAPVEKPLVPARSCAIIRADGCSKPHCQGPEAQPRAREIRRGAHLEGDFPRGGIHRRLRSEERRVG